MSKFIIIFCVAVFASGTYAASLNEFEPELLREAQFICFEHVESSFSRIIETLDDTPVANRKRTNGKVSSPFSEFFPILLRTARKQLARIRAAKSVVDLPYLCCENQEIYATFRNEFRNMSLEDARRQCLMYLNSTTSNTMRNLIKSVKYNSTMANLQKLLRAPAAMTERVNEIEAAKSMDHLPSPTCCMNTQHITVPPKEKRTQTPQMDKLKCIMEVNELFGRIEKPLLQLKNSNATYVPPRLYEGTQAVYEAIIRKVAANNYLVHPSSTHNCERHMNRLVEAVVLWVAFQRLIGISGDREAIDQLSRATRGYPFEG